MSHPSNEENEVPEEVTAYGFVPQHITQNMGEHAGNFYVPFDPRLQQYQIIRDPNVYPVPFLIENSPQVYQEINAPIMQQQVYENNNVNFMEQPQPLPYNEYAYAQGIMQNPIINNQRPNITQPIQYGTPYVDPYGRGMIHYQIDNSQQQNVMQAVPPATHYADPYAYGVMQQQVNTNQNVLQPIPQVTPYAEPYAYGVLQHQINNQNVMQRMPLAAQYADPYALGLMQNQVEQNRAQNVNTVQPTPQVASPAVNQYMFGVQPYNLPTNPAPLAPITWRQAAPPTRPPVQVPGRRNTYQYRASSSHEVPRRFPYTLGRNNMANIYNAALRNQRDISPITVSSLNLVDSIAELLDQLSVVRHNAAQLELQQLILLRENCDSHNRRVYQNQQAAKKRTQFSSSEAGNAKINPSPVIQPIATPSTANNSNAGAVHISIKQDALAGLKNDGGLKTRSDDDKKSQESVNIVTAIYKDPKTDKEGKSMPSLSAFLIDDKVKQDVLEISEISIKDEALVDSWDEVGDDSSASSCKENKADGSA